MSKQTPIYDVFLSYPMKERASVDLVRHALKHAELSVFGIDEVDVTDDTQSALWRELASTLWRALAESAALVIIVSPDEAISSATSVEVGAAMAWHKPIYIVHTGKKNIVLPSYLAGFLGYPISRVDEVIQSIKRGLTTLSQNELSILREIYVKMSVPTDRLLKEPASIEKLAREFDARCKKKVSGEQLTQELIRLRKTGNLPKLHR